MPSLPVIALESLAVLAAVPFLRAWSRSLEAKARHARALAAWDIAHKAGIATWPRGERPRRCPHFMPTAIAYGDAYRAHAQGRISAAERDALCGWLLAHRP